MYLNTVEVSLTPRKDVGTYNVQMNNSALDILSLIFEFKVATAGQISRFLRQKDRNMYVYLRLHRFWQAGLLESFKVFTGSRAGMPVYYMLAKPGLEALKIHRGYDPSRIKNYPHAQTLLSWNLFRHEAQVVELASLEAKNRSKNFNITFKGESDSMAREFRSDKNIEVLTPDYTVFYNVSGTNECVYTEFERTAKSGLAMIRKIERYVIFINPEERSRKTLRIIFQTPAMEKTFWLGILTSGAGYLQKLRILTTNIILLESFDKFLEPVYASEQTVKLKRQGRLTVDLSKRIKLFSFL